MSRSAVRNASGVLGVLDIGTSKVVCAVAEADRRSPALRLLGYGLHRSRGVKAGVITDLAEAETSVRAAIGAAEKEAGVSLERVILSVSCGRLKSRHFTANAELPAGIVRADDVERLLAGGRSYVRQDGRRLVHLNRLQTRLDDVTCGASPIGLAARSLKADLHAVTADDAPVRNLIAVAERCYLAVDDIVAASFASALAVTTVEERRLGVTCVDIGGGTSTIAAFANGRFVFTDAIPAGGNHVTYDLARALQTPLADAERIKALYGAVIGVPSEAQEVLSYPHAAGEGRLQTTRGHVQEIVRPRVGALLGLVRERMERGGVKALAGDRVVLTGGASQHAGIEDYAQSVLSGTIRVAAPAYAAALPDALRTPAFATLSGLLAWPYGETFDTVASGSSADYAPSYLNRVGQWLKTGF